MPNPFFVSPAWWRNYSAAAAARATARPFDHRVDRVLFRGACGPGARARVELASLGDLGGALDAGFTSVDGYDSLEACVADLSARHDLPRRPGDATLRRKVRMEDYSRYRYLLHMPGSATGSSGDPRGKKRAPM